MHQHRSRGNEPTEIRETGHWRRHLPIENRRLVPSTQTPVSRILAAGLNPD